MKNLDEIAIQHGTDKSSRYHNYCDIYENYFKPIRFSPVCLLEIGVQFGCSIKTWLEYFVHGQIYGLDCIQDFKSTDPRCHLFLGSQTDPNCLKSIANGTNGFDVVIDDGCHQFGAQQITFETLWPYVHRPGLYIIEDIFTWSDAHFNLAPAGYNWLATKIEELFLKGKQYHGKPHPINNPSFNEYEQTLNFIHCYKGLVIFGKKP